MENDKPELKVITRSVIVPTDDKELVEGQTGTEQEHSPAENPEADAETDPDAEADEEGEDKPDELITRKKPEETTAEIVPEGEKKSKEPAPVEGETPRERALRQKNDELKAKLRDKEQKGLFQAPNTPVAKRELSPEKKAVLAKYKPAEVGALKEVFDAMAEDMGFVKADQLGAQTYAEKADAELSSFLEDHPEYKVDGETPNPVWDSFKEEFKLYNQPKDPRDLKKIFSRIHRTVSGIETPGPRTKVNAQQEKARVASHAAASAQPSVRETRATTQQPSGIRKDMLKGFTQEELDDL